MVSLQHYLILSAVLFSIGVFGILSRRNILGILMSIELLFNAAAINFVAFNRFLYPQGFWGNGVVLFIIALAACEAVVGLALVLAIFRNSNTVLVERLNILKG